MIHRQTILVQSRVNFEIELSFDRNKFFILIKRQNLFPRKGVETKKMFCKILFLSQAKQLLKLFDASLEDFVSGLIRIKVPDAKREKYLYDNLQLDFGFMDKILTHMVGLSKQELR